MSHITPAIISRQFEDIKAKIARLEGAVPWVHLDIMDGKFVPTETWQTPDDLANIGGRIKIEAHLMVEQPEEILSTWTDRVDRVLVHIEATDHLAEIIEALSLSSCQLGIAVELATPLDAVSAYLPQIDFIQLMAIAEIGHHGRKFQSSVLDKIKLLRDRRPDGKIQVDGGLDLDTGAMTLAAGADILVAGSSIWQADDPGRMIRQFQALSV